MSILSAKASQLELVGKSVAIKISQKRKGKRARGFATFGRGGFFRSPSLDAAVSAALVEAWVPEPDSRPQHSAVKSAAGPAVMVSSGYSLLGQQSSGPPTRKSPPLPGCYHGDVETPDHPGLDAGTSSPPFRGNTVSDVLSGCLGTSSRHAGGLQRTKGLVARTPQPGP